ITRNSSSSLKKLGSSPNRLFKNSSADIGLPSALQKEVAIMCWMVLSFPSFNFIFTFCFLLQMQGFCPQVIQGAGGSKTQIQSCCPQTVHGFFTTEVGSTGSISAGSPSHSGSAK